MARKWDDEMMFAVMRGLGVLGSPPPKSKFTSICDEHDCSVRETCTGAPETRVSDCPAFSSGWVLTRKQMQAAHIVRQSNLDPGPPSADIPDIDSKTQTTGDATLEKYTLIYTERFTVLPPVVDANAAGTLKVDSGHIATSPAYRLAIFKRR